MGMCDYGNMTVYGYMIGCRCYWVSMGICGCLWVFISVYGCQWLLVGVSRYFMDA